MTSVSAPLQRLLAAALLAAMVMLGASAAGDSAIACAEPKKWDQDAYDACKNQARDDWIAGDIDIKTYQELAQGCCILSGGKWTPDAGNPAGGSCAAATQLQPTRPGLAPPATVATLNPAPPPPPIRNPEIAQTFTLAPVSPA